MADPLYKYMLKRVNLQVKTLLSPALKTGRLNLITKGGEFNPPSLSSRTQLLATSVQVCGWKSVGLSGVTQNTGNLTIVVFTPKEGEVPAEDPDTGGLYYTTDQVEYSILEYLQPNERMWIEIPRNKTIDLWRLAVYPQNDDDRIYCLWY